MIISRLSHLSAKRPVERVQVKHFSHLCATGRSSEILLSDWFQEYSIHFLPFSSARSPASSPLSWAVGLRTI